MKLRSLVFVVTLVAGMLVIAAPPAAANVDCIEHSGSIQGIVQPLDEPNPNFFYEESCADNFDASDSVQGTSPDGSGQGTATASEQYGLTFSPPDGQGQVHLASADAVGSTSGTVTNDDEGIDVSAHGGVTFDLSFSIPEGVTGSVFAVVNASRSPDANNGASSSVSISGGFDEEAEVIDPVFSGTDSFNLTNLQPGGYTVRARSDVDVGLEDGSADFEVTVTVGESQCDNTPTEGADIITGTPDDDFLCGGGGNDSIDGAGGNDIITGGDGSDSLIGGDGLDTIEGGADDDFIEGGPLRDIISGGPGNDGDDTAPVSGGSGPDDIDGGDGIDYISGGDGNDTIEGGDGADRVEGDLGNDEISGGDDPSRDVLIGCNFDDPLCQADQAELDAAGVTDDDLIRAEAGGGADISGDAGRDILGGSPAFDAIFGGPGNDFINAAGDGDFVAGGDGKDTLEGGPGHESGDDPTTGIPLGVFGGPGNDEIRGEGGDDLLEGGSGRDEMLGNAGSDKLRGREDNDCLIGGTRKDVLAGGPGNDRLFARDGVHDVVNGGPQFDRARVDGVDRLIRIENDNFQGGCP